MSTKTIKIGHTQDDLGMVAAVFSPMPPFSCPVGINSKEYVVGTDFTSGQDILLEIDGSDKIRFALVTSPTGTIIAYTEAGLSAPRMGKSLAIGAQTANIKTLIIFNT